MKNKKYLERVYNLVHKDIGGELYNEFGKIDGKKIPIIIKSIIEITESDDKFYILNFLNNFNKEGDYSNIVLKDDLTFKKFIFDGFDGAYIISQELDIPYYALEEQYDNEYCIKEGYDEYGYDSSCYSIYTEQHGQEILDEYFRDSLYTMEETIEHYGFDKILEYLYIGDEDKRMIVIDMLENEMSNNDEDEIVERLSDFKVGEHLGLIEKYVDLKEEIEEKEFEGESVGELYDELENIFLDIEYELRDQLKKYYTDYLERDLKDFLWDFGYISKDKNGEFKLDGDRLPGFLNFDEDEFVKKENWYGAEILSPFNEVHESYLLGEWFYIVKVA